MLQQYAELYGQAFVWAVALLAMRKLAMSPVRVMGILFTTFTVVELLLQRVLAGYGVSSLVLVLLSFFAMFGVLIWALCRFYGRTEDAPEKHIGMGAENGIPAPTGTQETVETSTEAPADARRALAAEHGLSARETDVFLLLAQGRSRRFICEELFVLRTLALGRKGLLGLGGRAPPGKRPGGLALAAFGAGRQTRRHRNRVFHGSRPGQAPPAAQHPLQDFLVRRLSPKDGAAGAHALAIPPFGHTYPKLAVKINGQRGCNPTDSHGVPPLCRRTMRKKGQPRRQVTDGAGSGAPHPDYPTGSCFYLSGAS